MQRTDQRFRDCCIHFHHDLAVQPRAGNSESSGLPATRKASCAVSESESFGVEPGTRITDLTDPKAGAR